MACKEVTRTADKSLWENIMWNTGHDAYLESRVLTADPIELVNLLYQACTQAVREARHHLAEGRIAERSREINKACADCDRTCRRRWTTNAAGRSAGAWRCSTTTCNGGCWRPICSRATRRWRKCLGCYPLSRRHGREFEARAGSENHRRSAEAESRWWNLGRNPHLGAELPPVASPWRNRNRSIPHRGTPQAYASQAWSL